MLIRIAEEEYTPLLRYQKNLCGVRRTVMSQQISSEEHLILARDISSDLFLILVDIKKGCSIVQDVLSCDEAPPPYYKLLLKQLAGIYQAGQQNGK